MQQQTSFVLVISGQPFTVPNALLNGTSIAVSYTPTISGQNYSVAIEGIVNATCEAIVLDTFTGTGISGSRTVNLSVAFDSFKFIPTWSNATQQFSVITNVTSTGNGQTFNANLDLANVHEQ